jgi:hypothetical protein
LDDDLVHEIPFSGKLLGGKKKEWALAKAERRNGDEHAAKPHGIAAVCSMIGRCVRKACGPMNLFAPLRLGESNSVLRLRRSHETALTPLQQEHG